MQSAACIQPLFVEMAMSAKPSLGTTARYLVSHIAWEKRDILGMRFSPQNGTELFAPSQATRASHATTFGLSTKP